LGRYDPLRRHLQNIPVGTDRLTLTFNDIKGIIGADLPASAYRYRAWWANDKTHIHARAWMEAGWKVESVDFDRKTVVFKAILPVPSMMKDYDIKEREKLIKIETMEMEEVINIPPITLKWSGWVEWDEIKKDTRMGGIKIPNMKPGVYEAKYVDCEERLTIGRASDLRMRIRQGLVKGKTPHSAGERIRAEKILLR
jgi:hypothetical protein